MSFKKAKNFEDLVKCNVQFLKGKLDKTPYHLGPLADESDLIKDELIELSEKYNILTLESQPAINNMPDNIQREYIVGCIKSNKIDKFIDELKKSQLEYIAHYKGEVFINCKTNKYNRVGLTLTTDKKDYSEKYLVTFICQNEKKMMYSCTGIWIDGTHLDSEKKFYDTKDYSLSDDNEIINFHVFDNNFNYDAKHCCKELIKIMSMIK
jgi:hypothetical protein